MRERTNSEGKRAIAAVVAGLIEDGETVILDGGSTGIAVAAALEGGTSRCVRSHFASRGLSRSRPRWSCCCHQAQCGGAS
ncbi:hypothetical protein [Sedimentibacter sp. B4]|uniref:hypothetical protein n=1 Tax=Sedimentibacter sp. B4 TaxID=304766 RepID=UPI0034D225D5